jgi:hypothetical protein
MKSTQMYRSLLRMAHEALEGTMAGLSPEQVTWEPPGRAFSIAANYVHVVGSENMGIQKLLRGRELLATTSWAGRTGVSEMPPLGPGADLKSWSRHSTVDLPALQRYGQAVYAMTDEYVASMRPEDFTRPLDLTALGLGQQSVLFVLTALLLNSSMHCGEISCLKGLQGLQGYPM